MGKKLGHIDWNNRYKDLKFGFVAANIASFFSADEAITQSINTYFVMAITMIVKPIEAIILGKL